MRRVKVDPVTGEDMVDPVTGEDMFEDDGATPGAGTGGMGDVKMAESQPPPMNPDSWLPGRKQMEVEAMARGEKVNPVVGALTSVADMVNIPTRAAAQFRGEDMSDPNAYFWRPEVEAMKVDTRGERKADEDWQKMRMEAMKKSGTAIPDFAWQASPSAVNMEIEALGQLASDPLMIVGKGGQVIAKLTRRGVEALHGAIPGLKNYVSGLSQIKQPILEKAATKEGMAALKEGATMKPEDLAQQVATDAGNVNRSREELAANSRVTQQQQVQSINDQLALENQGINARAASEAEQHNARNALENQGVNANLKQEAEARTQYLQDLAANSKITQQQQTELAMLEARQAATGAQAGALSDIKPGALGEDIKSSVMGGKGEMQTAWLKGDQESIGPLRDTPAPIAAPATKTQPALKVLTSKLAGVLEKYKAYDAGQGMRRISEGGKSVISDLIGHSQTSGHTIDDLLNIKAELRRARNLDKYKGIPFDLSVDEVAFGDADRAISETIDEALAAAAPKESKAISEMMKAKDRQYAITKDLLGDQARSLGQVQNTANIIQKVRAMGPEKARELIAGAESNPALQGLVPKLRQAFVDDLILSSMKNGEFSADVMNKLWQAPGMQEMKVAWLAPADLKRIDDALALGTAEIGKPAAVSATRVPMPARVQAKTVPMPPLVGSAADRSDGFYSRLAREGVEQPKKVGQSFSYNGQPDPVTAKSRVENIGNENEINQRALADLRVLDKINGTNHADQAMKIFEAGRLGMDTEGKMAAHPMQTTGARGFSTQKGQVIGRVVSGVGGGLLGFMAGHGFGAVAGSVAGERVASLAGDVVAAVHSNLGSPAGAVAAYRKMNAVLEARFPKAAKLAAALDKATTVAQRARIEALIAEELKGAGEPGGTPAPPESDRVKKLRSALERAPDEKARKKIQADLDKELGTTQPPRRNP